MPEPATAQCVRDAAYTWANRLMALRCMESRGLSDEGVLQKDAYTGRSLQHHRLVRQQPERCAGQDDGLFAVLFDEFAQRAGELALLFDPRAPEVAVRPSVAALKRCIALLSGTETARGAPSATDEVFAAPDALGWTYPYWNTEEKDRVFEMVRSRKGAKVEGRDIVSATCIYTEPSIVRFVVQNSLGAIRMAMHPGSRLCERWPYFVHGADCSEPPAKSVADLTFLDPACGSDHFLIQPFDLLYDMYVEQGRLTDPAKICSAILERNLYGIDIDERAVQIAALALVMKANEKAPHFRPRRVNLVAMNIRLPLGVESHEAWRTRIIQRLRHPLAQEAAADDLSARFFGEAAEKGVSLTELLTRRDDVVAANPPYMGSKNMGAVLKDYVGRHFPAGKRDLYAAFILRGLQLASGGGRVAMVTQQSWMFLRSYTDLRALEEEKRKKSPRAFGGLLRETNIEVLAHLGEHAWQDPAAAGAFVVIFVLAKAKSAAGHRLTAFPLVGPKSPEEKDALLREAVASLRRDPVAAGEVVEVEA